MQNWKQFIQDKEFRYIDHTTKQTFLNKPYTAMTSFAMDDVLTQSVGGKISAPTVRLWVHEKTVVLGIPDSRLPNIEEGVHFLKEKGYNVIVRNSGGLAVALDGGVLNLSLILPDGKDTSIDTTYEIMYQLITHMLRDVSNKIKAYEIVGSYCPGKYDLSIDGVKFAGISQRRIRDGVAVQIYIDAEGRQEERANIIRDFYQIGKGDAQTSFTYPDVEPDKMGSLSSITGIPISIEDMKERTKQLFNHFSHVHHTSSFSEEEITNYHKRMKQMIKRNEGIVDKL